MSDPVTSTDSIAEMEQSALSFGATQQFTNALKLRERMLIELQKAHGDPSIQTDAQKVSIADLILAENRMIPGEAEASRSMIAKGKKGAPRYQSATRQVKKKKHDDSSDVSPDRSKSRTNDAAVNKSTAASSSSSSSIWDQLSTMARLTLADRLLAPSNTLPETQQDEAVQQLRGRILVAQASCLYAQQKPRAAVPLLVKGITLLERAGMERKRQRARRERLEERERRREKALAEEDDAEDFIHDDDDDDVDDADDDDSDNTVEPSLELAEAHLLMCVLQSKAGHHAEALFSVHRALAVVLMLEDLRWKADPLARPRAEEDAEKEEDPFTAFRRQEEEHKTAKRTDDNDHEEDAVQPDEESTPPRARVYYAEFQAGCYHNLGVEQEHLGLTELALESYQVAFELASLSLSDGHPLSTRIKQCYGELFASLHYKHFATPDSVQKSAAKKAIGRGVGLGKGDTALALLQASFHETNRHQTALKAQTMQQQRILNQVSEQQDGLNTSSAPAAGVEHSSVRMPMNRPASSLSRRSESSSNNRPSSAALRRPPSNTQQQQQHEQPAQRNKPPRSRTPAAL